MNFEISIKYNDALDLYEVTAFGYYAEIRKGIRVDPNNNRRYLVYSLLMDKCTPIAMSQTELEKYIMFLEYCEFFLSELNGVTK